MQEDNINPNVQMELDFGRDFFTEESKYVEFEKANKNKFVFPKPGSKTIITLDEIPYERIWPKEGQDDNKIYMVHLIENGEKKWISWGTNVLGPMIAQVTTAGVRIDTSNPNFLSGFTWEIEVQPINIQDKETKVWGKGSRRKYKFLPEKSPIEKAGFVQSTLDKRSKVLEGLKTG